MSNAALGQTFSRYFGISTCLGVRFLPLAKKWEIQFFKSDPIYLLPPRDILISTEMESLVLDM